MLDDQQIIQEHNYFSNKLQPHHTQRQVVAKDDMCNFYSFSIFFPSSLFFCCQEIEAKSRCRTLRTWTHTWISTDTEFTIFGWTSLGRARKQLITRCQNTKSFNVLTKEEQPPILVSKEKKKRLDYSQYQRQV